jgi:hypothetical protein
MIAGDWAGGDADGSQYLGHGGEVEPHLYKEMQIIVAPKLKTTVFFVKAPRRSLSTDDGQYVLKCQQQAVGHS